MSNIVLGDCFIIEVLLQTINNVFKVSVFTKKHSSLIGLMICHSLDLFQLLGQSNLGLGNQITLILKNLKILKKISILNGKLLIV